MLPVRRQADVLRHLLDMAYNGARRDQIGQDAKVWFDRYNGIGLAKQWLDLLGGFAQPDCSSGSGR